MEVSLQYKETTQWIGLSSASTRNHHTDGPKANHALTIVLDQSDGARQLT